MERPLSLSKWIPNLFYGKKGIYKVRIPECESDDSELYDSDEDPDYVLPTKRRPYSETSDSEEDTYDLEFCSYSACNSNSNRNEEEPQGSSILEEPAIVASTMPNVQSTQQQGPLWKHVD